MEVIFTVGKNLRKIRIKKNYTVRILAGLSGVSKNQISRIELGETDPRISTLQNLALALEIDITDLFTI